MTTELSNSAKRVQDFLHARGFSFEVKELPGSTRTAQEAADSIVDAITATIQQKNVTYDFARLMDGAHEVKCSEFADAIIKNLGR